MSQVTLADVSDAIVLIPATTVRFPPAAAQLVSRSRDTLDFELAFRDELRHPAATVGAIDGAAIDGRYGAILTPNGDLVWESMATAKRAARFALRPAAVIPRRGHWVSLIHRPWAVDSIYHWLVDTLPRLGALSVVPPRARIAIPLRMSRYCEETLALVLEGESHRVERTPLRVRWRVERAHVVNIGVIDNSGFIHRELADFVKSRIIAGYRIVSAGGNRILVSRRKAKKRRVTNEGDLWTALRGKGFQRVCLEDLAPREQVALFAASTVVVAPHGAALTNMMFSRPETRIIELHPATAVRTHYMTMATGFGLDYRAVIGGAGDLNSDFAVDIEETLAAIDS